MPESPFKLNYSEIKGSPSYSTAAAFQRQLMNAIPLQPDSAGKMRKQPQHYHTSPLHVDPTMARALDIARREVAIAYEHKIKDIEEFWSKKVLEIHEKHSMAQSGVEKGAEASAKSREEKLKKVYNKRLRKFEKDFQLAFEEFSKRSLVQQGALDECRREAEASSACSLAREASLKEELSLVLDRCKSYKSDLLELQEERYYHQKWQKCAMALAETIIKLASSAQQPDKHGMCKRA